MSQPDTWPRDQKKKDDEVSVTRGTRSPVLKHVRFLGSALAHTMAFVRLSFGGFSRVKWSREILQIP